jgi:hypothetical protein
MLSAEAGQGAQRRRTGELNLIAVRDKQGVLFGEAGGSRRRNVGPPAFDEREQAIQHDAAGRVAVEKNKMRE